MPIHAPFEGVFVGNNWGKWKLFAVLSLWECSSLGLTSYESNNIKIASAVLPWELSEVLGSQKVKRDISPICWDSPSGAVALIFGLWDDIADVITHVNSYNNWFRSFRVLTPLILPFSVGLAGRPDNNVCTTVLHCDNSYQLHCW